MTTARVGKTWAQAGLKTTPLEAILGTLSHYGVTTDEAAFKEVASKGYPSTIARDWTRQWKGTGQFSQFPRAAAFELWSRWMPEKVAPESLTQALADVMVALSGLLSGRKESPVQQAFAQMKDVQAKVPLNDKHEPEEAFLEQALGNFDEKFVEVFDQLAEALAKGGFVAEAKGFVEIEEFLLPPRKGVSSAIVRAAMGERDPAVQDLVKLAADPARSNIGRLLAVDGLLHLQANHEVAEQGRALLAHAEKESDLHLALDLAGRLKHVYTQANDRTALASLEQDVQRLEAAHDVAHPTHRRRG